MVAYFSQLHDYVDEIRYIARRTALVQKLSVPLQNGAVVFLLQGGELHFDQHLLFGRNRILHISLQSSQQIRPQYGMQMADL